MAPPEGGGGESGGENEPPLSKPPNSAAAASAKEPYPDEQAVENAVAPTPGAPTAGTNNVLTLFVPTETTVLQMGVASPGPSPNVPDQPGFRMSTEHHAHLTAQTPLTTISMGAAGGEGMGGVPGLSIYSVAQKDERIVQAVKATYGDTFKEEISGKVTCEYKADYELNVEGDKEETIQGHHKLIKWDSDHAETGGATSELFIGAKSEISVGAQSEISIGACLEVYGGGKAEVFVGYKRELTKGPSQALILGNSTEVTKGTKTEIQWGDGKEAKMGNTIGLQKGNSDEKQLGGKKETLIGDSTETHVGATKEIHRGPKTVEVDLEKKEVKALTADIKCTMWQVGTILAFK